MTSITNQSTPQGPDLGSPHQPPRPDERHPPVRQCRGFPTPGAAVLIAMLAVSAPLATAHAEPSAGPDEPVLYERLGGYDAIAAVVDALIARMEGKFEGYSEHSRMRTRQLIVDFMCSATGGPCFYAGRDIHTAHAGLGITPAEWEAFVGLFGEVMSDFDVPAQEQEELATMLLPLEGDIVRQPQ
jgi:hemoglobin